jgi:hypothetical protein
MESPTPTTTPIGNGSLRGVPAVGLLKAGDPKGEVATSSHAKEAVRELYAHADEATAAQWIDQLIVDMADRSQPIEVRSLGRTLKNWRNEIIAWHRSHASNGPTEAVNNLVKRVKRAAFGFRSFAVSQSERPSSRASQIDYC